MGEPALKYYTAKEYLAFERASQTKHEFYKGEIFEWGTGFSKKVTSISATNEVVENRSLLTIGTISFSLSLEELYSGVNLAS